LLSLAGTAQEAKSIKQLFDASLLTGADATEQLSNHLFAPKVLHIATHGSSCQELAAAASGPVSATAARGINATAKIANPSAASGLALANANLHNTQRRWDSHRA